jgi:hypothetical protein
MQAILRRITIVALFTAVMVSFAQPPAPVNTAAKGDTEQRINPKATELLRKMSDYLGSQKAFTVHASFSEEVVLVDGQKVGYESSSQLSLRRPDRFRADRHGVKENLTLYYDGKTMTLFQKGPNFYAVEPAPPTVDTMLDFLITSVNADIPGSDLLMVDSFDGLVDGMTDANDFGQEEVGGVATHHLGFRNHDVDWQIWIQDGDKPLPLKYVITTKWTTGAPSYSVVMTDWNMAPHLDDATFKFVPPAGAQKIDFVRPADIQAAR